ncbi:unnamed protein product [Adineta steineri]|uniref:NHL repeat containing protein n=1 Tax=Adineta steineri TaxID=433720 RepID=A0A813SB72_9BILA|nr:unnamed protein product [Adineta steineri]
MTIHVGKIRKNSVNTPVKRHTRFKRRNPSSIMSIVRNIGLFYNLPKFSAYATWSANGVTVFDSGSGFVYGIFIDTNNTLYISEWSQNMIQVWLENSTIPIRNISGGLSLPYTIFVTVNGDIYVDNGYSNSQVDKWTENSTIGVSVMNVKAACWGLFVDIYNNIYCSQNAYNQVIIKSLNSNSNMWIVAAGADCSAPSTNTLNGPRGIYVDTDLNLYVADCGNDRIQLFLSTQLIGKTVATGTIALNCPSGVVLDANGYLFITDTSNQRIIGSGPNGYRCLVGCTQVIGSASNQLYYPTVMSFDTHGNMFIADGYNHRVQKFYLTTNIYSTTINQPRFCPSTTWYINATTFANSSTAGTYVYGIFVSINNTVYVANQQTNTIIVWYEGSINPDKIISGSLSTPYTLFATPLGDIYVDNGAHNGRVDNVLTSTIVAGNGTAGSTATTLNTPIGIFVDAQVNLYVADTLNSRVQMFPIGQLTGITLAGASVPGTITLNQPNGITLDGSGYLFIADTANNRIIGSGPYGFRCLFGCTTIAGSSSSQLYYPVTLSFDTYGNLFVADRYNNRVQKFILASNSCSLSYNQPTFCYNTLWYSNASTFASSSTIGSQPYGIFINGINTVYVPNQVSNTILTWPQGSNTSTSNSYSNLSNPYSLVMSMTGDIYIDNGYSYGRVDKYIFNTSNRVTVMNVNGSCYGLFIDINNNLYCSLKNLHQVVKLLLNNVTTIPTIAAGNGSAGSLSNMLNSPQGIYVDSNLNLYIADSANNRIQFVQTGQLNGVTIAGNGSSTNFILNYPTGIVLDTNGYLFIVDSYNHRIVGSSFTGFRCIVGCSGGGSTASQLSFPQSMAFDSYGNIYVTDRNNSRQYRPPPLLLLRVAAAVPQLALLLLPPVPQVALLLPPVPQQVAAVPQVAPLLRLPLAVPLRAVAAPQVAVRRVVAVLQVVLLRAAAVPQVALLLPLVLQQVPAVPQVVLPRAVVVQQLALLPRLLLAVLLRAVVAPQVAAPQVAVRRVVAVLQVVLLRAAAVPRVVLLPRPPVLLQAAVVPQAVLLLPLVLQQVPAVPQAVLPRAAVVPQVALLQRPPLAVPLRAVAAPQVAARRVVAVPQVALLLRPPVLVPARAAVVLQVAPLQVAAVLQVQLLPPPAVRLQAAVVPQVAPLQVAAVLQVALLLLLLSLQVLQQVVAVLQVVVLPRSLLPVLLQVAAVVPQVVLL